jgi:hypothetical protein
VFHEEEPGYGKSLYLSYTGVYVKKSSAGCNENKLNRSLTLIVICYSLFFVYPADSAERSGAPEETFIWLEYGKQLKKKDGTIIQRFWIRSNGGLGKNKALFPPGEMKAVYRVNKEKCYSLPVRSLNSKAYIEIKGGRPSFFEVCLTASDKGTHYTAETSFYLFGKSGEPAERGDPIEKPDIFPIVSILSPVYNYWPQTGQEFTFEVNSEAGPGKTVEIKAVDRGKISNLGPAANGKFIYMPPHDRDLNERGPGAYKGCIIRIKEKRGGRISKRTCTLLLHRSRYAYHDLKPGLYLISGTMAFFLSLVIALRRKKNRQGA